MNLSKEEKLVLVTLAILLIAGSVILYSRHSRSFRSVRVVKGDFREELTLEEVESRLEEERRININTATVKELTTIPGIGETLSARIMEYRSEYGDFTREDELLKVEGIGPKKFEKIRKYVKVD